MRQPRGAAVGSRRAARVAQRAARREEWLLAQQHFKRTYANEQGPYPVPLSPATVVSCVVAAVLVFGVGVRFPLAALAVITAVLLALPMQRERVQEQWTWTAWLGAVVGSAVALGFVVATVTDPNTPPRWLPGLLAVGLPVLVTALFVIRNAPRGNRARLAFLSVICGGCLATLAIVVTVIRIATRS